MTSEWVSIKEEAERLGVSADTIRRRMKRGELVSRKQPTAQGYVWEIEVPAAEGSAETPAQDIGDLLERERGDLIAQRDGWQEQARQSGEAEKELRRLVLQAQALVQALPATTGDGRRAPQNRVLRPRRATTGQNHVGASGLVDSDADQHSPIRSGACSYCGCRAPC